MKLDIHAHIIPPEALLGAQPADGWRPRVFRDAQGRQCVDHGGKVIGSALREFVDIERMLAEQDAAEIDVLALSPWTSLLNYHLPAEEGQQTCRLLNEAIARSVHNHPSRLAGLGIVPLQDAHLAASEVVFIVRELGLHGIEIGTNVNGSYLGDERLLPFWEAVAETDILVFVHPVKGMGGDLMRQHYLWNLFGNPTETGATAAHLILSGMLERFPTLKICLAHGGGTLPYVIGRLDHGFRMRPEAQAKITRPPSTFLRQLYFDTITHSAAALRFLIAVVGTDHLLMGSDYPFDMGAERPQDLVSSLGLTHEQTQAVCGATAARLLGFRWQEQ